MDTYGSYEDYLRSLDIKTEIDIKIEPSEIEDPSHENGWNWDSLRQKGDQNLKTEPDDVIQNLKTEPDDFSLLASRELNFKTEPDDASFLISHEQNLKTEQDSVSLPASHEHLDEITKIEYSKYPIVLLKKLEMKSVSKKPTAHDQCHTQENNFESPCQRGSVSNLLNENGFVDALALKRKCGEPSSRTWNKRRTPDTSAKLLKCCDCNYKTNVKAHMKNHVLTHNTEKLFPCSQCNFKTNHYRNLYRHLSERHSGAKFGCSECEFITSSKESLKSHVLNHSVEKLFKCEQCVYETNDRANFRRHFLKHSSSKRFHCVDCGYETNYRQHLRRHVLGKRHKPKQVDF